MIWIRKGYVVERKKRKDGLYEFVVTRGNRVIDTIVPNAPKEERYIRNQLKKGKDIYDFLSREVSESLKLCYEEIIGEIVEVKRPSLLLLQFMPFEDFHYLNTHGGKVGLVVGVQLEKNEFVFEIKINEQKESIFIEQEYLKVVNNEYVRKEFEDERGKLFINK